MLTYLVVAVAVLLYVAVGAVTVATVALTDPVIDNFAEAAVLLWPVVALRFWLRRAVAFARRVLPL